jgi:hypothetical protein
VGYAEDHGALSVGTAASRVLRQLAATATVRINTTTARDAVVGLL